MAPLALVANLATRWRHLHKLQIWPPDGATCISCKFGHQMALLALFANLATRWSHLHKLQIWPPDGTTCISCKFGHQMAPLALVANKIFQSNFGTTWIGCKFGHQMAPLALVTNFPTRFSHLHCHIALDYHIMDARFLHFPPKRNIFKC